MDMQKSIARAFLGLSWVAIVVASFDTCFAAAPQPESSKSPAITFEATASTGGVTKSWNFVLRTGHSASFEMRSVGGSDLKGKVDLNDVDLARIETAAKSAQFSSLPRFIAPTGGLPIHAPSFTLRLGRDGKEYSVELYAPAEVKDRSQVNRFMTVWNAIFDLSALRPTIE